MYKHLGEIKKANRAAGFTFFKAGTICAPTVYRGIYFITTDREFKNFPLRYTIREALPSGKVIAASEYMEFDKMDDAVNALRSDRFPMKGTAQ